jgi:gliding motility-associated-like protein
MLRAVFILLCVLGTFQVRADHAMGGQITWKCNGNGYVFELVFYRDCNGAEINTISENIEVWNHPSIGNIPVLFISRQDISPTCTAVPSSPNPLLCGSGTGGGNGVGAVEKIIYRSNPIVLPGVPPAAGWIFTYDNFSRNGNISNLQNPISYGLTISATMFTSVSTSPGICTDNSAEFLQEPYFISCVGEPYEYNLHPVDIDFDSLHMVFGTPYDNFSGAYSPPANPIPVPFETGYSINSPTPDASFGAGNIPANLDPLNGNLTFTSNMVGSYVIKIQAESYRHGQKISVVEREIQVYVNNCAGVNTAPDIVGPFAGAFNTTVTAGTLVNFTLQSTDVELLQDGTPQSNFLTTTGIEFGAPFTSNTGCLIPPCAFLDQVPVISGSQGVSTDFTWQTDCAHVFPTHGLPVVSRDYTFVFKVQDNYCQIPKVTYKTITITVVNPGIIPATDITCITTAVNGDLTVTWDPVTDPTGTFVEYNLYSVQNGLVGTYPFGTTSASVPAPGQDLDFYVGVVSGCNGNAELFSDTLSNVFLTLLNPANGTAVLDWNTPVSPATPLFGTTCDIQREYPAGTWTTVGTVPYETTHFIDTIDICQAFLNYRVVYNTPGCFYNSNIVGDLLEDMQTPSIPVISSVSIDTITGNAVINWNVNNQPDTKGYIIYWEDANGFIVEIDTVYGINNTSYTYTGPVDGPLTFSVSAFDSCLTAGANPTYQTSAKGSLHTSMFVSNSINKCNSSVDLSWTPYDGWNTNLVDYTVFAQQNGGTWQNLGNTSATSFTTFLVQLSNYCIVIRANKADGTESFSNKLCFLVNAPSPPATHYLRVATVSGDNVELRHQISTGSNVTAIKFQKYNPLNSTFENLVTLSANASTLTFVDTAVDVHYESYTYRAIVIDSCGLDGTISNLARTVLLKVTTDQISQINQLNWSTYIDYDGGVLEYQVYRGIDGNYDSNPFVVLPPTERFVQDDVSQMWSATGKFCYYVAAYEAANQYGIQELSASNTECIALIPLVYVPNAFTPEGFNPIFIPVVSFSDISKYEFSVVDRWGQVLFQTTDIAQGWDGKHPNNDRIASNDVYMYVVKVVDGNNQEYYYRGTVTLIK